MERDRTLPRLRLGGFSLALLALALACGALWPALDNPTISNTSRGDNYPCLAPYDTVLNDANNFPGGESPPNGDQIAERCREAGEHRFDTATTRLVAGGVAAVAAGVIGLVAYRLDRRSLD